MAVAGASPRRRPGCESPKRRPAWDRPLGPHPSRAGACAIAPDDPIACCALKRFATNNPLNANAKGTLTACGGGMRCRFCRRGKSWGPVPAPRRHSPKLLCTSMRSCWHGSLCPADAGFGVAAFVAFWGLSGINRDAVLRSPVRHEQQHSRSSIPLAATHRPVRRRNQGVQSHEKDSKTLLFSPQGARRHF